MKNAIYGMAARTVSCAGPFAWVASCADAGSGNLVGAGGLLGNGNRVAVREDLAVGRLAGHVAALPTGSPAVDIKREQRTRGFRLASVTDVVSVVRRRLVRDQDVRSWRVPV